MSLARLNEEGRVEEGEGPDEADARLKEEEQLPDPATFLVSYPRCKRLVDTFRANPNTHNKTPLAVLHEYATRLSLEVGSHYIFMTEAIAIYAFGAACE